MPVIMERTLQVVNRIVEDGMILSYAIGGGVAAAYYGEPTLTYDLDLFVYFPSDNESLQMLTPLYQYLGELGYQPQGEGIFIDGIVVQFLPPNSPLVAEAIENAVTVRLGDVETRFFALEYLLAIMLQTFRPKDKIRITNLLDIINDEDSKVRLDLGKLDDILNRFGLKDKWDVFVER